ncbi:hypothetical protein [Lactiplantibacillus plantarum]|uniref:hypothetical protein n=1 Tax=Lactiplantibacillus plantarum TaxID=1590 RepID=UPI0015EC3EA3|nr:hypothetical protein [Lactiplantibacillus plantarum]MBA3077002.1 hypothetical protein [Lactiplantibacillus plantarum]MBA3081644.1 hypothetical protein [Lactiplantibacillus plantarum]MBA3082802.1 hypothetical protein [Lactiplantibacillus plantarum]MCG0771613.1 hypothetical protein [Lactiplantibacillus plantarum]MCG0843286.1 hypothetical protein [Lactiplantibacillus plantarum]
MIKVYRKTATIKAEQFDGSDEMVKKYNITPPMPLDPDYTINTLEGDMVLGVGGWIATGVNGEHWPITDDVFKKTYAELPVIPKVYGDTIEEFKAYHYKLSEMFDDWDWNYDEQELIARAWLDGYVVEGKHD